MSNAVENMEKIDQTSTNEETVERNNPYSEMLGIMSEELTTEDEVTADPELVNMGSEIFSDTGVMVAIQNINLIDFFDRFAYLNTKTVQIDRLHNYGFAVPNKYLAITKDESLKEKIDCTIVENIRIPIVNNLLLDSLKVKRLKKGMLFESKYSISEDYKLFRWYYTNYKDYKKCITIYGLSKIIAPYCYLQIHTTTNPEESFIVQNEYFDILNFLYDSPIYNSHMIPDDLSLEIINAIPKFRNIDEGSLTYKHITHLLLDLLNSTSDINYVNKINGLLGKISMKLTEAFNESQLPPTEVEVASAPEE